MEKGLARLVAGTILSVATIFSLAGCEAYKNKQLTESETRYKEYYKTKYPIQVPEHIKGTIMDPFPPALRGYDAPELIRWLYIV